MTRWLTWLRRRALTLPAAEEEPPQPKEERDHWDYLEKLFFENYKKEIDQEENIWRTVPVFVAAIALELTALIQLRADIARLSGAYLAVCAAAAGIFLISLGVMAFFLIQAVRPRKFSYLAPETDLLAFAKEIEQDFLADGFSPAAVSFGVKREMQDRLLEQMAVATTNKRRVIRQQAQYRGRAVWPLFISVAMILLLFVCVVVGQLSLLPGKVDHELANELLRNRKGSSLRIVEGKACSSIIECASHIPLLPQDACRYDWLDIR